MRILFFKYSFILFILLIHGCASFHINVHNDKIAFYVRSKSDVYFHYSKDGFIPHKMSKDKNIYIYQVEKTDFKYFFTNKEGLIKIECPLKEYDDFGGYSCIFSM